MPTTITDDRRDPDLSQPIINGRRADDPRLPPKPLIRIVPHPYTAASR
jgi:hypothetical protein